MGRDYRGRIGATRRGRGDSPTPCSSRRGRTTPTAAERCGPRRGQGRTSSRALHLAPGSGRRFTPLQRARDGARTPLGTSGWVDDFIRGAQVDPVLGGEVEECQRLLLIVGDLLD